MSGFKVCTGCKCMQGTSTKCTEIHEPASENIKSLTATNSYILEKIKMLSKNNREFKCATANLQKVEHDNMEINKRDIKKAPAIDTSMKLNLNQYVPVQYLNENASHKSSEQAEQIKANIFGKVNDRYLNKKDFEFAPVYVDIEDNGIVAEGCEDNSFKNAKVKENRSALCVMDKKSSERMRDCSSCTTDNSSDKQDGDFDYLNLISNTSADSTSTSSDEEEFQKDTLECIAEESNAISKYISDGDSSDISSSDENETLKSSKNNWCKNGEGFSSDISTSSSEKIANIKDKSTTRCNGDFQWIPKITAKEIDLSIPLTKPPISRYHKEKPIIKQADLSAPSSLDRRRNRLNKCRQERDIKSRSSHVLKEPRLEDYVGCQSYCCNSYPDCHENFLRRHERIDPQKYGSSPMLIERGYDRNSHTTDNGRNRHDNCNYYQYHPIPHYMCSHYGDPRNYFWNPNKIPDQDDKVRKLQMERDNLQLQVQVLGDQIEAQTDKITDLEKNISEKKQLLISSEDTLQREMLSRSSLETQKLELMSAISELKLQHAALERDNFELRNMVQTIENNKKQALLARMSPQPVITSSPLSTNAQVILRKSPSPSPVSYNGITTPTRKMDSSIESQSPQTPPATYRRQIELHYSSLPRQQFLSNGDTSLSVVDSNANPANGVKKGVAFGMGLSSLLGGWARGQSVPNLAETEKIVIDDSNPDPLQSPTLQFNKNKGIKKILGKIKRSGSGNLEDFTGCGEFQRGGIRATASARLGWSSECTTPIKTDKPFAEWNTDNICEWLQHLGLEQYIPDAKKWVKTGQQLLESNINEIEKELNIKNSLHRKKLQLALIDTEQNSSSDPYLSKAGKLDTAWVLRWLDDGGLPQYKENFLLNRIDGRVLHRLTVDDLTLLHVTSLLHVASIKRGIQVLRENEYEPGCLQRRSLPDDPEKPTPKQLSLWTSHRVMEWLRAVDLAEYAPNLRGAGVHGGLMVLENKFTAELLASLLSIPPGKTLLRRHLSTHFKELLGKDVIQAKREAEATLGYIPLTPASKLKVTKKSHFSLKRSKSKSEADYGDLVCPLNKNSGENQSGSTFNNCVGMTKMTIKEEGASQLVEEDSLSSSSNNSPLLDRNFT